MLREIITIDQEKCIGCGLCVKACQEGAIGMVDGKARLLRDDYCDGLGNCLPACPTDAISFETREAAAFDSAAVKANLTAAFKGAQAPAGCPGSTPESLKAEPAQNTPRQAVSSELANFPVQLQLVAVNAPFLKNAKLLIAADCAAYAHGDFHRQFMAGHVTLIGCPKLDDADYVKKLTDILVHNNIRSLKVARMEVPCCGGLVRSVTQALKDCGKMIPWQVVTLSAQGDIIDD
ncbi:MAG: 4Fe-4S binding protein [Eubacteriales bacterium]|nr:4Fe-4S binding protein [Eubacteriales bacterium]